MVHFLEFDAGSAASPASPWGSGRAASGGGGAVTLSLLQLNPRPSWALPIVRGGERQVDLVHKMAVLRNSAVALSKKGGECMVFSG